MNPPGFKGKFVSYLQVRVSGLLVPWILEDTETFFLLLLDFLPRYETTSM